MDSFTSWIRWQLPYTASCFAHFPVTLTRRVILRQGDQEIGLAPLVRRFWDKWGVLPRALRESAAGPPPVWINMNSGGEVVIGWAMLKAVGADQGRLVFSTESHDGFDLLCRTYGHDRVFFPPWDTWLPVRRVLAQLRPRALIFVQNAYFPVLLRQARRAGVKTALVNGLLSRNVEIGNPFMRRALALEFYRELDAVAVQRESDYHAALQLGIRKDRLAVTGDMYADLRHLRLSPEERAAIRQDLGLDKADRVVIVGSTHPQEEPVIKETFRLLRQRQPGVRLIVAPRQIHEGGGMAERLREGGWKVARASGLSKDGPGASGDYDILLLDTFGQLGRLYGIADVAYIGASLVPLNERRAGHNVLEPLVHGVVPLFGPHMGLWRHVVDRLVKVDATLQVDGTEALAERIHRVLEGDGVTAKIRQVAEEIINEESGAVDKTVSFLKERIGE